MLNMKGAILGAMEYLTFLEILTIVLTHMQRCENHDVEHELTFVINVM